MEEPAQDALLERARQADPAALTALYDRYVNKIYSYVYHCVGSAELAEDITGQVFMRMLEAIKAGRPWQTSFFGWLYRIAHNLVIDHYRERSRASFVDIDEAAPVQAHEGDPFQSVETQMNKARLHAALALITEEQAQVITLRFLEGLSIAETAEIMGKTEGAIKALQYRAVLALKRVMEP
ncbi:MAG: sigma-70 family RNA polymerase sigma factor [Anaerolineae bacterium]